MVIWIIIITAVSLLIKFIWNPKLDKSNTGKVLLWFGPPNKRQYIKLN